MGRSCSTHGDEENSCRILVRKPDGKRPLVRPRRRRVIILNWILKRQDGVVWTGLIWLRIRNTGGLL
jgi:hypothetical protein